MKESYFERWNRLNDDYARDEITRIENSKRFTIKENDPLMTQEEYEKCIKTNHS